MNAPIVRLYVGVLLLFALLVGFTSNWAVFDADELEAKTANKRPLLEARQIERGKIFSSDGELIAESLPEGQDESLQYVRRYPQGALFGNPIGYSFFTEGSSGFERAEENTLVGNENEFVSLLDQIRGRQQEGSTSSRPSTPERSGWRPTCWRRARAPGRWSRSSRAPGAVKVMASSPGFDPNTVPQDLDAAQQGQRLRRCSIAPFSRPTSRDRR